MQPEETAVGRTKLSFREYFELGKWSGQILLRVEPRATKLYILIYTIVSFDTLVNSFLMSKILDLVINTAQTPGASLSNLYPYLAVMFGYNVFNRLFEFLRLYYMNYLNNALPYLLKRELYLHLINLGIETLEEPEVNNKITRASDQMDKVLTVAETSVAFFVDILQFIIVVAVVASYLPFIIPFYLLLAVPFFLFDKKFRSRMYDFKLKNTEKSRIASDNANSLFNTNKLLELSIFKATPFLDKKYLDFANWYVGERLKVVRAWQMNMRGFWILFDSLTFIGILQTFSRLISGAISVGTTTFHISTLRQLQNNLGNVIARMNYYAEQSFLIKDTKALFDAKPSYPDGSHALGVLDSGPAIEFKNVSFKYPRASKYVYKNLNIKIKAGEKVAIIGHNGAGKTTLVKLIARIYRPDSGDIIINGKNLNDLTDVTWNKNIGILFQDFNTYGHLTVRENIIIGDLAAAHSLSAEEAHKKLLEASENADALSFIEELPGKFNQILTEKIKSGTRLSTGQWQKIALARFFYRNAPLVIFDEPTSSIDAVSEYKIFNKIYDYFAGKTVVIISHRFSTVRNADRIIVVEHGKIIEEGSHEELLRKDGYYAKAFKLQAEGYIDSKQA